MECMPMGMDGYFNQTATGLALQLVPLRQLWKRWAI